MANTSQPDAPRLVLHEQRNIIIGALLLLFVGGSFWMAKRGEQDQTQYVPLEHRPDYYLEGVDTRLMDQEGYPSQRLVTERMTHYLDDDSTTLHKPRLTLYDRERPPWEIQSESGWLSGDGEVLLLQGAVKIDRTAAPGVRPLHIRTRDLRVQPADKYVETDAEVNTRSYKDQVDAKGMQIWYQQPIRIKLLANVRGRYEVNP